MEHYAANPLSAFLAQGVRNAGENGEAHAHRYPGEMMKKDINSQSPTKCASASTLTLESNRKKDIEMTVAV